MLRSKCCSDDTLRVRIKDRHKRTIVAEYLRSSNEWIECVEGMRNVVVQFDSAGLSHADAMAKLDTQLRSIPKGKSVSQRRVEIPVCYGGEFGPELESIAEMLGMSPDAVIAMHTSRRHLVELIGFTPGFAYVSGLNNDIKVPRLSEPRVRVEPGSIGIAGGLTGMYALAGPGGWPLIGRTPLALFRADKSQPMLMRGGTQVRFVAIDASTYAQMAAQ